MNAIRVFVMVLVVIIFSTQLIFSSQEFETQQVSLSFFDEHNEINSKSSEEVVFYDLYNLKLEPVNSQLSGIEGFVAKNSGSTISMMIGFFVIGFIIYLSLTKKI
ncbi:MAG: hypothetical protein ACMXYB_01230 [Candidatus Woesearchaeota archaeon]